MDLSDGQILPYYTKGTSRTKLRPSHVKIIVFRPLIWAVERLLKMEQFGRFPIAMVRSYFMGVFLGRETLEDHSQLPKKANKCSVGAIVSFLYIWRHRVIHVYKHTSLESTALLQSSAYIRESVDSLCRDGADMPMPPYIGKACTRPNLEDLSLFRYLTIVYESLCTQ